jgi:hypothetical protein
VLITSVAVGLWANSAVDNGAYGTTAGIGKSGLRGDGTGESSNGVFGATTSATGNGVSGFNAGGVGVLGTSTSNYGVKGVTNTPRALLSITWSQQWYSRYVLRYRMQLIRKVYIVHQ